MAPRSANVTCTQCGKPFPLEPDQCDCGCQGFSVGPSPTSPNTSRGYTEAEGYAASLRQQAKWVHECKLDGTIDADELEAAASYIERLSAATPAPGDVGEIVRELRETAADIIDWHGKTMKEWDEIRAKCEQLKGSDLPRLMFEGLVEGFSELMVKAADTIQALSAATADAQSRVGYLEYVGREREEMLVEKEARLAEAVEWRPIETAPASIQEFAKHCEISDDRNGFIEFGGTMEDSRPFVLCLSGAFSKVYDRWFILPFVDAIARPVEGA